MKLEQISYNTAWFGHRHIGMLPGIWFVSEVEGLVKAKNNNFNCNCFQTFSLNK